MKIRESSMMSELSFQSFENMIGKVVSSICFEYGYVTNIGESRVVLFSQELVLSFEKTEAVMFNDYQESEFLSQLHVIHSFFRESGPRPYNSIFYDERLVSAIKEIQVWGLKDDRQDWDIDRIDAYMERGLISAPQNEMDHLVSSQHVIHISLENSFALTVRSDSRNCVEIQVHNGYDFKSLIKRTNMYLWKTFR